MLPIFLLPALLSCTSSTISLGNRPTWRGALDDTIEQVGGTTIDTTDTSPNLNLYADGTVWELGLSLEPDAYNSLRVHPDQPVLAMLSWQDQSWAVEVHIKGSSSYQDIGAKPSLVVDVNARVAGQRFMGVTKFNLHNDCYDPSQMSETLAYGFYRAWGYPAAQTSFAQLSLNGENYGFYTIVEPHNDDFLERWFDDPNGNLYENKEAYCDVTDTDCMEAKELDEGNHDALLTFADAARDGLDAVTPLLQWERFIQGLALEAVIAHWDSYSYDLSNYKLYHEPSADQWTLLTQSMDLDFGYRPWSYPDCARYGMDPSDYTMGRLAALCQNDPACHAEFTSAVLDYADALEASDGATQVDELDAWVGDWIRADPRRYASDQDYEEHVACLRKFFTERPAQLRAWAAGAL